MVSISLGFIIVPIEAQSEQGLIKTYFDGVWWAVTTLTTVGYGDYVPVTTNGKMIGIMLQLLGTMMFGITIAVISSVVNKAQDEFYWNRLFERMDRIEKVVGSVKKNSEYIVKDSARDSKEADADG